MTTPLHQNVSITRGDDFNATFTFDQSIAGFADIRFTVRSAWASGETDDDGAVFSASVTGGGVSVSGAYTATLDIGHAATVAWLSEAYVYDVQVETVGGKVYTTQRGKIFMCPDVTRG